MKRTNATPILEINPVVGVMVGKRIREIRQERGLTMKELAERCGMASGHPKARMYEIEVGARREGLRFGTLYVIAMALGVEVCDLMPSVREVSEIARVRQIATPRIGIE